MAAPVTDADIQAALHFLQHLRGAPPPPAPPRAALPSSAGFHRTRTLLSALTAVCVSAPDQHLALSVALPSSSSSSSSITVAIAQDGATPPESIAAHLHAVWSQLRALAAADVGVAAARAMSGALRCCVVRYCVGVLRAVVLKYMPGFEAFREWYMQRRKELGEGGGGGVATVVFALARVKRLVLQERALREGGWMALSLVCALVAREWMGNRDIAGVVKAWHASEASTHTFNLPKTLRKLSALTLHIDTLLTLPNTPSLRPFLSHPLRIHLLPPLPPPPPPAASSSRSALQRAFNATGLAPPSALPPCPHPTPEAAAATVHPEATLLAYLHAHARPPVLRYIAAVKPCVWCCRMVGAYAQATGRGFVVEEGRGRGRGRGRGWAGGTEGMGDVAGAVRGGMWEGVVEWWGACEGAVRGVVEELG